MELLQKFREHISDKYPRTIDGKQNELTVSFFLMKLDDFIEFHSEEEDEEDEICTDSFNVTHICTPEDFDSVKD